MKTYRVSDHCYICGGTVMAACEHMDYPCQILDVEWAEKDEAGNVTAKGVLPLFLNGPSGHYIVRLDDPNDKGAP